MARIVSTGYVRLRWGPDDSNFYFCAADENVGEIRIGKVSGGSEDFRNTNSASVSADTWYDYQVEWPTEESGDDQVFRLIDDGGSEVASVTMSDTEFGQGGYGYRLRKVGDAADYARIIDAL